MTQNNPMNDEKLYEEIEYVVTAEYRAPNGEPAKSRIDRLMRLIKSRDQRIALAARIDELHKVNEAGYVSRGYMQKRLATLTQEQGDVNRK
jgi:hypothetical protein